MLRLLLLAVCVAFGLAHDAAADSATGGGRAPPWQALTLAWPPGVNPNNGIFEAAVPVAIVVQAITCRLEVPEGSGTPTFTAYKAPSGTAFATGGTALSSTSFNTNGTAATNQTLTLVGGATSNLAAGDSIGVRYVGAAAVNTGGCTVWFSQP